MKSLAKWCCSVSVMVLFIGCSSGSDALLQDGRTAMDSLDKPTVDTALVTKGIASLKAFSERFADDARRDSALFMLASLQGALGRNEAAVKSFFNLIDTYPKSKFRANSIILASHIYEEVGDYTKATACLEKLIREYPKHDFVVNGSAQALIDHMGKPLEDWLIPFQKDSTVSPGSEKVKRSV